MDETCNHYYQNEKSHGKSWTKHHSHNKRRGVRSTATTVLLEWQISILFEPYQRITASRPTATSLRTGAKIFSTKCRCGKIADELGLHGLSCTKNTGCFKTFSHQLHPQKVIDPHWSPLYFGTCWPDKWVQEAGCPDLGPLVQRPEPSKYGMQQLWILLLRATTKTLPNRQVSQLQKLRLQNAKNTMTSKPTTTFNQWLLRPLVCMASPLPLFWVVLQRNLLMRLATPGSTRGSTMTSVCPWLWSRETLPAYWPVCKLDLILSVPFLVDLNVLTTIATCPCISV